MASTFGRRRRKENRGVRPIGPGHVNFINPVRRCQQNNPIFTALGRHLDTGDIQAHATPTNGSESSTPFQIPSLEEMSFNPRAQMYSIAQKLTIYKHNYEGRNIGLNHTTGIHRTAGTTGATFSPSTGSCFQHFTPTVFRVRPTPSRAKTRSKWPVPSIRQPRQH